MNKKVVLIIVAVVAAVLLVIGGFGFLLFGLKDSSGRDRIAERFLTDKIQADKKVDIIIFPQRLIDDPDFMYKVELAKAQARNNGYSGAPELVRPRKSTSQSFYHESVYRICKPASTDCLYFLIEVRSQTVYGSPSGNGSKRSYYIESFAVYPTEAEAVQAYDN